MLPVIAIRAKIVVARHDPVVAGAHVAAVVDQGAGEEHAAAVGAAPALGGIRGQIRAGQGEQ